MIIGIDVKELSKGRAGIAAYIRSMLDWFHRTENDNQYVLFSGRDFEMKPTWDRCKKVPYRIRTTGSIEVAYALNPIIEQHKVDVFWGPEHCIPLRKGSFKTVVTVHDIAVILNPEWGTAYNAALQRFLLKRSLNASDAIVAISNSTKNDLVDRFHVPEEKVKVIYNGDSPYHYRSREFSEGFKLQFRKKYGIGGKYFLFCGTIEPRKNIVSVIEAFEKFCEATELAYNLVLVGGLGWKYRPILERASRSSVSEKILVTGYVSEEEKEFLYRNAEALLFPSYYEGLGLPVIEAMSCGTPVITARNSSLPEVGGEAAFYAEPADNTSHIAEYMGKIAEMSVDERRRLSENCLRQAQKFSARDCAESLLKVFRDTAFLECRR